MSASTALPTVWSGISSENQVTLVEADPTFSSGFYADEWVTVVHGEDLELLWTMRLRVQRDDGWFVVSDDLTEVYGEGENEVDAIGAYRSALSELRRVLARRQDHLEPQLMMRLTVLQSILPPEH